MLRTHDTMSGIDARSMLSELHVVRRTAQELLGQLRNDRAFVERRCEEMGRRDPLKVVTGRSAMDNAVQITEHMLHSLDRYSADVNGTVEPVLVPVGSAP